MGQPPAPVKLLSASPPSLIIVSQQQPRACDATSGLLGRFCLFTSYCLVLRRSGLCNAGRCASSLWPLLIVLPGHALHLLWHVQTHIRRWENEVSSLLLWWLALYAIMKVHQTLGWKNLFTPLFLIYLMVFLKCNIFCPIYCSPTLIICCVWQIKELLVLFTDMRLQASLLIFFLAVLVLLCTFSLSCEPNRGQNVESFLQ